MFKFFNRREREWSAYDDIDDNDTDLSNEEESDSEWRKSRLYTLPVVVVLLFIIYWLLFLLRQESVIAIWKHGYWDIVVEYLGLRTIFLVPVLGVLVYLGIYRLFNGIPYWLKSNYRGDYGDFPLFFIPLVCFFFVMNALDKIDNVNRIINIGGITPSDTVRPVATKKPYYAANFSDKPKGSGKYGPSVERSLGEYLKSRMPQLADGYDGWGRATLTVDAAGTVREVKANGNSRADKALLKALKDMGKWICLHHKGQTESVKISFSYLKGKPYYMLSERIITSADGSKLKVEDEFDLSGDFAYALWSVHKETDM